MCMCVNTHTHILHTHTHTYTHSTGSVFQENPNECRVCKRAESGQWTAGLGAALPALLQLPLGPADRSAPGKANISSPRRRRSSSHRMGVKHGLPHIKLEPCKGHLCSCSDDVIRICVSTLPGGSWGSATALSLPQTHQCLKEADERQQYGPRASLVSTTELQLQSIHGGFYYLFFSYLFFSCSIQTLKMIAEPSRKWVAESEQKVVIPCIVLHLAPLVSFQFRW